MPAANRGEDLGATEMMRRRYMNVPEVAIYIDSTPGSIRQLVQRRRIPHLRVAGGRRILFDVREIDKWLADDKIAPDGPETATECVD